MTVISYQHIYETEIRKKLIAMVHEFGIQALTFDYSREDNRSFQTVYFRVFVTGTTASNDTMEVMILRDTSREDIISMIAFTRSYCSENKIRFENKFELDGYTYKNRKIFRAIKKIEQ